MFFDPVQRPDSQFAVPRDADASDLTIDYASISHVASALADEHEPVSFQDSNGFLPGEDPHS